MNPFFITAFFPITRGITGINRASETHGIDTISSQRPRMLSFRRSLNDEMGKITP